MRKIDLVHAVTAAYRVDLNERDWLEGIASTIEGLVGFGGGTLAYRYEVKDNHVELAGPHAFASGRKARPIFRSLRDVITTWSLRAFLRSFHPRMIDLVLLDSIGPGRLHDISWSLAARHDHPEWAVHVPRVGEKRGMEDGWGVTVPDRRGGGLLVACPETTPEPHSEAQAAAMRELIPHLQAAQRLRGHVNGTNGSESVEAVITPDGHIEHAVGAARGPEIRNRMSQVVRTHEAQQSNRPHSDWRGEPIWPGILDGRWSLVERFESDGRRFMVAHANAPGVRDPRRLTERERRVAECVATGAMNKEVAATLECSEATVESTLASVFAKLGVRSRVELVLDYRVAHKALAQRIEIPAFGNPVVLLESKQVAAFPSELTQAEREVAVLVLRGLSNDEIAATRGTRARTVANQVRGVFEKCNVRSRAELVSAALSPDW